MNLTLAIDQKLAVEARAYAERHGTTLTKLVRAQLAAALGRKDRAELAREFVRLAKAHPGTPARNFTFDRAAAHRRGAP